MGMPPNFGPYDPIFRQQQHQSFMASRQQLPNGATEEINGKAEFVEAAAHPSVEPTEPALSASTVPAPLDRPNVPVSVPPKPVSATPPQIIRSTSQPAVQRPPIKGSASRSHSPAPSNVSFHGNGHPTRRPGRAPFHGNGTVKGHHPGSVVASRSASGNNEIKYPQRVPGADEFPVLGGSGEKRDLSASVASYGKTAAQVLSEPAPYRPSTKVDAEEGKSEGGKSDKDQVSETFALRGCVLLQAGDV